MNTINLTFRPEIQGIRAIAVLIILMFHVGFDAIPSGYIGVDVFFVVSGYLIAGMIIGDVQSGNFMFAGFYKRRVRRLAPALLATIVGTLFFASFLFSTDDYSRLAKEVFPVILGVSNIYFSGKYGYFGPVAPSVPFLHTWSLAVEEQVYLFTPFFIWFVLKKHSTKILFYAAISIAFVSLALSQIWLDVDPRQAYYLTPFRVFEFSIGSILHWLPFKRSFPASWKRRLLGGDVPWLIGLSMIVGSAIGYSSQVNFPGVYALLPCVGTAFIIAVYPPLLLKFVLINPLFQWLGLISYSLYLVHWPIVVLSNYYWMASTPPKFVPYLLFFGSIIVGAVFYGLFERPFRNRVSLFVGNQIKFVLACSVIAILIMGVAAAIIAQHGWDWRISNAGIYAGEGYGKCRKLIRCELGAVDGYPIILTGDSHAKHLSQGFDVWGKENDARIISLTAPSCNVTSREWKVKNRNSARCRVVKALLEKELAALPDALIIVVERWKGYMSGKNGPKQIYSVLNSFLDQHRTTPVIVVGQAPEAKKPIYLCGRIPPRVFPNDNCHYFTVDAKASDINRKLKSVASNRSLVSFVDISTAFCSSKSCLVSKTNRNIYMDQHHLSGIGSELAVKLAIGPVVLHAIRGLK